MIFRECTSTVSLDLDFSGLTFPVTLRNTTLDLDNDENDMHEFYLSTGNTWDNPLAICSWSSDSEINSLVGFRWESPYIFQNYIIDDAYGLFFVYDQNYDDIDIEWHFEMSESPEPFVEGNGNNSLSTRSITSTSSAVEWIEDDLGVGWWGQDTKLTYALQEVVNSYSPTHFVLLGIPIEDGLKRCYFRSINFASYYGAELHVEYTAVGFATNGIRWQTDYTDWDGSTLSPEWLLAVNNAASTWGEAGANFEFIFSPGSENDVTVEERGYLSAPGLCEIQYIIISGTYYMYTADMILNSSLVTLNGYCDVESVAIHEFGHFLHLKDLYNILDNTRGNVMYGNYLTPNHDLGPGDIAGIIYLYGIAN